MLDYIIRTILYYAMIYYTISHYSILHYYAIGDRGAHELLPLGGDRDRVVVFGYGSVFCTPLPVTAVTSPYCPPLTAVMGGVNKKRSHPPVRLILNRMLKLTE